MSTRSGKCACGKITLTIPESVNEQTVCHCNGCSKGGGGLGSTVLVIPSDKVQIQGELKTYVDKETTSGKPLNRQFCGDCGNPILSYQDGLSLSFVKTPLFDNCQKVFKPVAQIFCSRAEKWAVLPDIPGKDTM